MKKHILTRAAGIVILLIIVAAPVSSQSVFVAKTGNHMDVAAQLSMPGFANYDLALGAVYSIAGVLDIGFVYGTPLLLGEERWNQVGLSYAVAPIKQSATVPVSVQLYGEYIFRAVDSDFLTQNRLIKEGRGYLVGLLLARQFVLVPAVSLEVGALAEYRRRLDTTSLTFVFDPDTFVGEPDVDYREYPLVDRASLLSFGVRMALAIASANGHAYGLTIAGLVDQDGTFSLRPGIGAAFAR